MNNTPKEIVQSFYNTDPVLDLNTFMDFLDPDVSLEWHSSSGLRNLNFEGIKETFLKMKNSFDRFEAVVDDIIAESDKVVVRYRYVVRTIERPNKEDVLGNFITMWRLKGNKLHSGYQISQQEDTI